MKNNRGYTLVELLAIVTVLSIIVGMSSVAFNQVQNNVLEKDYENVISYIESTAVQYANDTGIAGKITVQDLIDAGYITPDDKDNIYNPINNDSINCNIIDITYESDKDQFSSTFKKEDIKDKDADTNKCTVQEKEYILDLCSMNGTTCEKIDENKWFNGSLYVYIKQGNNRITLGESGNASSILWGRGEETESILVSESGNYKADVIFKSGSLEYGSASAYINIDRTIPEFQKITSANNIYYEDEESGINQICFFESKPTSCENMTATATECKSATKKDNSGYAKIPTGVGFACANDLAGNVTNKPKGLLSTITLAEASSEAYRISGSDFYTSKVIEGKAQNNDAGITAYTFTTSSTTPTSWTTISLTYDEITQQKTVSSDGKYYFWVKDGDGNPINASVDVGNIKTPINTLTLAIDTANSVSSGSGKYSSISLKGTAQNNYWGIVAYAFTTTDSKPTSWKTISSTYDQIVQSNKVTENGKYYFWVKYGDANNTTDKKEIEITQILTEVNSLSIAIDPSNSTQVGDSGYYTKITLKGTAHNNTLGIKAYAFNNSTNSPSSWTTVSPVSYDEVTASTSATANKTYYFWVKYSDNTTDKKSITINNLVTSGSTSLELYSEGDSTITDKKTITNVKYVSSVTLESGYSGYVDDFYISGSDVVVTAKGGTKKNGSRNETNENSTYLTNYSPSYESVTSCTCSVGTLNSDNKCIKKDITGNWGHDYYRTLKCNNGVVNCAGTDGCSGDCYYIENGKTINSAPSSTCASGYSKKNIEYYNYPAKTKYSASQVCNKNICGSSSTYELHLVGKYDCIWNPVNPTCSTSSQPKCNKGDVLRSSTCYYCTKGTITSNGKSCSVTSPVDYSYWKYVVSIVYYKSK